MECKYVNIVWKQILRKNEIFFFNFNKSQATRLCYCKLFFGENAARLRCCPRNEHSAEKRKALECLTIEQFFSFYYPELSPYISES